MLLGSLDALYLERQPLASLGMSLDRKAGREIGAGALAGVVLVGLVALCGWVAGGYHLERAANAQVTPVVKVAWLMLGVGLFEEALFHGYLFQRAIRGLGTRWAQVVISLLFCLAHPFSTDMEVPTRVVAMITTFIAGWMLGLCYLRTRHLALPVGVHMGWNWFLGTMGFGVSGKEVPTVGGRPSSMAVRNGSRAAPTAWRRPSSASSSWAGNHRPDTLEGVRRAGAGGTAPPRRGVGAHAPTLTVSSKSRSPVTRSVMRVVSLPFHSGAKPCFRRVWVDEVDGHMRVSTSTPTCGRSCSTSSAMARACLYTDVSSIRGVSANLRDSG